MRGLCLAASIANDSEDCLGCAGFALNRDKIGLIVKTPIVYTCRLVPKSPKMAPHFAFVGPKAA